VLALRYVRLLVVYAVCLDDFAAGDCVLMVQRRFDSFSFTRSCFMLWF
jgi:hypothetical protein